MTSVSILLSAFVFHFALADSSTMTVPAAPTPSLEAQAAPAAEQSSNDAKAVKLSIDNKSDVMSSLRGGSDQRATYLGAVTLGADLNFAKLLPALKGLTGTVQGLGLYGQSPSSRIGDLQGADQLAAAPGAELYQAWLQQSLFDDHLAVLAGLHDLNNEFYATDSSLNFMNTSFVIGPELLRSGRLGPSVWPTTALGVRLRVQASDSVQASVAGYDGVPGDPADPGHSSLNLRGQDGVMVIGEVAVTPKIGGLPGKYSLGGWGYNHAQDDLSDTDDNGVALEAKSRGIYFLVDQKIYAPVAGEPMGLNLFLRLGWADASADPVEYAGQTGILYTGLLPGRDQDQLGFGAAIARAGSHYRAAVVAKGGELAMYEGAFELTYRVRVRSWLWVQPDLQWIAAPSMNPAVADALVGAGRVQLTF